LSSSVARGTRVAIVCIAPLRARGTVGGTYSTVLAELLTGDGLNVELWSRITQEEHAPSGVPIVQVWRPGLFAWLDIVRAVIRRRPEIVHFQHYLFMLGKGAVGEISTLALMISLKFLRVRVVTTLHDVPGRSEITPAYIKAHNYRYPVWFIRAALGSMFKFISQASRAVIVHQEIFADRAVQFGVRRAKIEVIPHMPLPAKPVDRGAARRALGLSESAAVALFFGYATGYKGLAELIECFAALGSRDRPIELLLGAGIHPKAFEEAGYGGYYAQIEKRAAEIENVRFVGFIPEQILGNYICAADVGILPYKAYHGASGPLFLYLGYDRPVLVSQQIAAHTPELVAGVFEVEPRDIARIAARFFDDPHARDEIQSECRSLRELAFSSECADLTRAAYARALA